MVSPTPEQPKLSEQDVQMIAQITELLLVAIRTCNTQNVHNIISSPSYRMEWKIKNDMTALMVAASESSPEVVSVILARECEKQINQTDNSGRTALHYACQAGNAENVKVIIAQPNVMKDARTNGGYTPLMMAVRSGDLNTVVACLNKGCNPFLENGLRETALTMSTQF